MRAMAGVPLELTFGQGAQHLASVKTAELGIQTDLSKDGEVVKVDAVKAGAGTYKILRSEGCAHATLIVE